MSRRMLSSLRDALNVSHLKDVGLGVAGGALGSIAFGQVIKNVDWFNVGTANEQLAKRVGVAAVLAAVGGALLKSKWQSAAWGWVGGLGAVMAQDAAPRLSPKLSFPSLGNYYLGPGDGIAGRLAGGRAYDDEPNNLFGLDATRVMTGEDAAFSSIMATVAN